MTEQRSVQLLLDADALKAYGRDATVGEMLGEVEDEASMAAFTAGSLAQALADGADRALLELLIQRDSCTLVTPLAEWEALGAFLRRVGPHHDVHDAYLVMLALMHRAYILTASPDRYTVIYKSVKCIPLQEPWTDGIPG